MDHVNLTVRDFKETVDWYRKVFQFKLVEEALSDGVRWGILRSKEGSGDHMLCIYEYAERSFWDRHELRRRGLHGVSHWGFRISDPAAWLETLRRLGLDAARWEYPHSVSWYVQDPTGYEIEVAYWKEGVKFGLAD
jgi:catechol 2,3-dioxygenase-like lactoylglutathione lyase family enzyme